MHDCEHECPRCGGGPLYQDRWDAARGVAHCDDCGAEMPEEEYRRCVESANQCDIPNFEVIKHMP